MDDSTTSPEPQVDERPKGDLLNLTAQIVSAYVSNNPVEMADLSRLINETHAVLGDLDQPPEQAPREELKPKVPIKKSVTDDYIICLEDGKRFKSMKRHLRTHYNLSPEEYRARWGLPADYPMVAKNYARARSHLAKKMGLGTKKDK